MVPGTRRTTIERLQRGSTLALSSDKDGTKVLTIRDVQRGSRLPAFTPKAKAKLPERRGRNQLAVLLTTEFEGIGQNGGVGTYYRELAAKLNASGWNTILVIIAGFLHVNQTPKELGVTSIFDLAEITKILTLSHLHQTMRAELQDDPNRCTGLDCLLLLQALEAHYPTSRIFVEFHEMFGFGYLSVKARQSGFLGNRISIGVTMHSGHEWIFDANRALISQSSSHFLQISAREEQSFRDACLSMYPSDSLHQIVNSFGWQTETAKRIPYFIPIQQSSDCGSNISNPNKAKEIIFFGRLEERKGLFEFIDAVVGLHREGTHPFRITFLGKSIRLFSTGLRRTTSIEYIRRHLGMEIPFQVLSNLSSEQAIAYVRSAAANAIVCLASPSDNFPNAALEMGQLPVPLVVSDTLGFQQTLALVERRKGVNWFEAGCVQSLQQNLLAALHEIGQAEIPLSGMERLLEVNQNLLATRLGMIEASFPHRVEKTAPSDPQWLLHEMEQAAATAYSQGLERAKATGCRYLLSALPGTWPGEDGIQELLHAAHHGNADVVFTNSELASAGLVSHDALHITDLLSAEFVPPGCLLLRTDAMAALPRPRPSSVALLHHQLVAAAVVTGLRVAVLPYPLTDRAATQCKPTKTETQQAAQAELAKYLTLIPGELYTKRTLFHLCISSQQLQSSLARWQPSNSSRQNAINIAIYLITPARQLLRRSKRLIRRLLQD